MPIRPMLFRFVKTAEGEGFMEWQDREYPWIIEFHNPDHGFNLLPKDMKFLEM